MSSLPPELPQPPDRPIDVRHDLVQESGVYFGLDEERYHAALALSASGIKQLRVSTLDWFMRSPLNPERDEEEDNEARLIGRAYHRRICEGRAAFAASYHAAIDPADYPDALRTNEELCAAIARAGGPVKGVRGLRKAQLIEQLLAIDPQALVWDRLVADHAAEHIGKILLSAPVIHRIEVAATMIEAHPQLKKAFTDGAPEVSVFWTDAETGVPCKCRFDYLKPRAIVDLKSFDARGLPLDKAIARAVALYKYNIQAAFYLKGAEEARGLIAEGRVFGDADPLLMRALHDASDRTFLFVFQSKGMAPVARGKVLAPGSVLDVGHLEVEQALYLWARCWETFGAEPWVDVSDITTFEDTEFPAFLVD
jgi:hypothetical protein